MRFYKSPLDTAKDLSENVPSASLVSHIVPFRKEGTITKLEKSFAMRCNAANKNFVIEAREREQEVRIRKERKETEFRSAQQITDEKREFRNQRIKEQK